MAPVKKVIKRIVPSVSVVEKSPGKSEKREENQKKAIEKGLLLKDTLNPEETKLITATKIQLPTSYLSPSQIEMYLRCPRQYMYRYVEGKKSPPAVAMVEGTTHHAAIEHNNLHKIKKGSDLPEKEIFGVFAETWKKNQKEIEDWEGEKPEDVVLRGKTLIRRYLSDFAPTFRPESSEETFYVPVGPVGVLGVIDAKGHIYPSVRKTPPGKGDTRVIVDYKTVGRAKTQKDVETSLQLSSYAYAHEKQTGEKKVDLSLCSLVKETGQVKTVSARATEERKRWFRFLTVSVANAISCGNFPVTSPSEWVCSEKFCGYWSQCRGKVEKTTVSLTVNRKVIKR